MSPNVKELWLFSDSRAARNSNVSGLLRLHASLSTQRSGFCSWVSLCSVVLVMAPGQGFLKIFHFPSFILPSRDFAINVNNITASLNGALL